MERPGATRREILRFTTAGSVDDGKSTLIGRLLHDTKSIFEDQAAAIEAATVRRGGSGLDLALLTDGLRAEREQGITIDVAYRYFATPRRKFVIADTPGHVQYTRNMVTGASTAHLALILVDARKGISEQTRRHAAIATLLALPRAVFCINKMDLVGFDQGRFDEIRAGIEAFLAKLDPIEATFVPICALDGDQVVERSDRMPWYSGPPLLELLESVPAGAMFRSDQLRFPVQYVLKPTDDGLGRRYLGRVVDGTVAPGDRVRALPGGREAVVVGVETADGPLEMAYPPLSVAIVLDREIDVSRGSLLVPVDAPDAEMEFDVNLCWLGERPVRPGMRFMVRHGAAEVPCMVTELLHRLDMETLEPLEAPEELGTNDLARVRVRVASALLVDDYRSSRGNGAMILVDPGTYVTVGAAMRVGDGR